MGAKTKKVRPESIASPFAEDLLQMLQGKLSEGAFGTGVGPMQREAGTAVRQFLNSGGGEVNLDPKASLEGMLPALEAVHNRRVGEQVGDLREGFGINGTSFGTSLARGEADLRGNLEQDFTKSLQEFMIALDSSNRENAMVGLEGDKTRLGAAQLMQQMGDANFLPFLQMAMAGIFPDEIIASPNPWLQLGTSLIGAVGGAAGARK